MASTMITKRCHIWQSALCSHDPNESEEPEDCHGSHHSFPSKIQNHALINQLGEICLPTTPGNPLVRMKSCVAGKQKCKRHTPSSPSLETYNKSIPLQLLPKDILVNDILGCLTDKSIQTFLSCLGERRLKITFRDLAQQFCTRHGSRLENSLQFTTFGEESTETTLGDRQEKRALSCPECYAEAQNTTRCNGCKVFYPRFRLVETSDNFGRTPGLWCQTCDRLAYCNSCLSNDKIGSVTLPEGSMNPNAAFGAFGRKRIGKDERRGQYRQSTRACSNYCCRNVFTNTMCGEFVCDDCGDEHQRRYEEFKTSGALEESHTMETCDECGKSTCLDPNCLVCADFRLIHISCNFRPERAYSNFLSSFKHRSAESTSALRRTFTDLVVGISVLVCLSKLGWFHNLP